MTLEELYASIDGNYEQAQRVLKMDKLIDRYIRRLKTNDVAEKLAAAGEAMDAKGLFESAHALKGVCANLGLVKLADMADEITEEFRPENTRKLSDSEVKAKLDAINELFGKTLEEIGKYENS